MVLVENIEDLCLQEQLMNTLISLILDKNAMPTFAEVIDASDCNKNEVFARYTDIETLVFDTVDFITHFIPAKLTEFNAQIKSIDMDNPLALSKAFLAFDNLVYQLFISNAGRALLVIYTQYKNEYRLKHCLSHIKNIIVIETDKIMRQLTVVHNAKTYINRYFDAPIFLNTPYFFISSRENNYFKFTKSAKDN
ncbi:MAG: hypothetical protein CMF49_03775 [Legionellales bacterium]|nr:hypothetical protein [Legionellales bacterium]